MNSNSVLEMNAVYLTVFFIKHSLIQNTLNENSKLYYVFVDYEKAFDTVKRDAL